MEDDNEYLNLIIIIVLQNLSLMRRMSENLVIAQAREQAVSFVFRIVLLVHIKILF